MKYSTAAQRPQTYTRGQVAMAIVGFVFWYAPGVALAQRLGQGIDNSVSPWRVLAAFLICSVIAVVAALALKSRFAGAFPIFRNGPSHRRIHLIEKLRMAPHVELCVVVCDGEEFLVSSSPQGIRLLRSLSRSMDTSHSHSGQP